jgi:hypothetical protein
VGPVDGRGAWDGMLERGMGRGVRHADAGALTLDGMRTRVIVGCGAG